jgi:preprotein translocase subunit SecD
LWGWFLFPSFRFYSSPDPLRKTCVSRRNPLVGKILNLGLDLQGGIHLLLELKTAQLADDRTETVNEAMDRAIEVIRNRIDQVGLSEPLIVRQGEKWLVVQMPGVKNREQAKDLIGRTALLEFRLVEPGIPSGRACGQSPGTQVGARGSSARPKCPKTFKIFCPREPNCWRAKNPIMFW